MTGRLLGTRLREPGVRHGDVSGVGEGDVRVWMQSTCVIFRDGGLESLLCRGGGGVLRGGVVSRNSRMIHAADPAGAMRPEGVQWLSGGEACVKQERNKIRSVRSQKLVCRKFF